MSSGEIRKELDQFQRSVKKLSAGVGKASNLWQDNKYQELSSSVSAVANMSRDVILSGEQCCSSIDKVDKIASESY